MASQAEYNVTKQSYKKLYAKVKLLNYQMQTVDEWETSIIGSPTFTINGTSDIRRTCSLQLAPTKEQIDVGYDKEIWLDKYIKIYLGIEDNITHEIIWTDMGIYILDNPSKAYSATSNTFTIKGLDLMSKLTGLRGGNLEGITRIIQPNANVKKAIIETLAIAGFHNYVVEECPYDVPNQINIDIGSSIYDILKQLRDIYPNYQMYFDVEGVFHYEPIPTGQDEQIIVNDDIWEHNLISYQIDYDFQNVKNKIEVFGKTHDIKNYSDATISENNYILNIEKVTSLRNNLKVGFTAPNKLTNPHLKINELEAKPLVDSKGNFAQLEDRENVYYVAKYLEDSDSWYFMGEITPWAIAIEDNEESPFYVNGTIGELRIVLNGGEYDNIYTSSLAQARADFELYRRCRLADKINLTCVPIYWLDVNTLIEITLPNKQGGIVTNQYMINSINTTFGVGGTQTIQASRYYPYYNYNK